MEPLPDVSSHLNEQVAFYPIQSTKLWPDPAVTIKTEPPEDNSPEVILPDRSYVNPESDKEEEEDPVPMEMTRQHFTTKIETEEQLLSEMGEPLETYMKIEEFSIKTEPEEDLSVFLNMEEKEDEDESMLRRRQPEITSELEDISCNTDEMFSHSQCFPDREEVGEDSHHANSPCNMKNKNTQLPGSSHIYEELIVGQDPNTTLNRNEQIGKKQFSEGGSYQKASRCDHSDMMQCLTYTGETAYRCAQCGKQVSTSVFKGDNIAAQMNKKSKSLCRKGKRFECQYCGHRFSEKGNLDKHVRSVHLKEKVYECQHCGQKFAQNCDMKHHVQIVHLKVKQHECEHCGHRFGRSCDKKKHVRTVHLKEKPFECQQCGQKFGEKCNMDKHIRTVHLKQKQYECRFCGQRFGLSCDMNKHIKTVHMKIKQHECQHCGQRFGLKGSMVAHVQTVHLKNKMFKCQHCGQRFGGKGNMRTHILSVHLKVKRFECQYCKQRFSHRHDMMKHVQHIHHK